MTLLILVLLIPTKKSEPTAAKLPGKEKVIFSDIRSFLSPQHLDTDHNIRMVLGYDGASKVVLQQKGTGALSDAFVHLANDQAHFIYGRVTTGDEESKRTKFVFISWAGPSLSALKRAKLSGNLLKIPTVSSQGFRQERCRLIRR